MPRARRHLTLLLAGFAVLACAHRPVAPPPPPKAAPPAEPEPRISSPQVPSGPTPSERAGRLALIRKGADELLTSQAQLLWESWTRGTAPDFGPSGKAHAEIFSVDTIAFVRSERDMSEGDERRALSLLHAFLVGEYLSAMAPSREPSPATVVTWEGQSVPGWRVPSLLATESDAARRASLEHAWAEAERKSAPARDARWQAIARAASKLGYGSLLELAAELRGESVDTLAALAGELLDATGAAYRGLIDAQARLELGEAMSELRGRDLPRLWRSGEDSRAFPSGGATADVTTTLSELGLELPGPPAVVLDLERRPGKDPRALAVPVEVPGNVRVSYTPLGGIGEVRALLHEMGVADYYARITSPVLEFRRLGAVTSEAWADLFEDLGCDPAWLAERTGLADSHISALVRSGLARRLHLARTLAARLLVEVARVRTPDRLVAATRGILERAFARKVEADELDLFLADPDPLLEAADELRALLLAARARVFLAARTEGPWWRSTDNGAFLAAAFAEGSRLTPLELARSLGGDRLDASALASSAVARAEAVGVHLAGAERP